MNRKVYIRLSMGYPTYNMDDRLRTERSGDIELADMGCIAQQGVEQPARPSDASDRPLLLQRPEPAYLLLPRPRYSRGSQPGVPYALSYLKVFIS